MPSEVVTANFPGSTTQTQELGVYENRESANLDEDITSTQATVPVSDTTPFAADMYVEFYSNNFEIARIASVDASGGKITFYTDANGDRKAYDGTVTDAHNEGDTVNTGVPAKFFNQTRAEVVAMQNWLGKDGDTWTADRALQLRYTGTSGTPTLEVGTVSGQGDPEPLIHFSRSTDSGDTWSTVGQIDYDPTNDQVELSDIEFVAAASSNINLEDGQELRVGTDYDTRVRWDESNTRTELATDNPVRVQRQASLSDGGALDSPILALEAVHDSDTSTSVTASTTLYEIEYVSTVSSGSQAGQAEHRINNRLVYQLDTAGRLYGNPNQISSTTDTRGDFRWGSTNEPSMLYVDADEDQVVVHGGSDPDYGALFVLGRKTGSGADNDVVATLGEDGETVQLNGNNTGTVRLVQIQTPSLTSSNAVSPNHLSSLGIESAPDSSDANVNPSNVWALRIASGKSQFGGNVEPGSAGSVDLGAADAEWANLYMHSDAPIYWGAGQEWQAQYDSTNTRWELTDGTNDAIRVADTSLNVDIPTGALQLSGTTLFENDRDLAVNLIPNSDASLDLGSGTRQFQDGFFSSSLTLADTATLSWTTDSAIRRLASNDLGPSTDTAWTLEPADITTDGGTANSPVLTLRAKHDSDTTTGVTSSSTDYTVDFVSRVSSGSQDGHVRHDVGTSTLVKLHASGNLHMAQNGKAGVDGTLETYRTGDVESTDFERVALKWNGAGRFDLTTEAGGTGTVQPLRVFAGANTSQIVCGTGGNVGVGSATLNFQLHQAGGTYAHLGAPSSQPTLSNLENLSWVGWLDETNSNFVVEVKDSSGNTLTGTVSVS